MTLRREFLSWDKPALPAAADSLIARYASDDELDLSQVILVFPGRRAARRMLELLVEKTVDRWPGLVPPAMVTFDRFPEMLYPQQLQLADDLTQLLVWKHALGTISATEIKAALPHVPEDDAVPAWLSLCDTLRRQHNELAADGMEFDQVCEALNAAGHLTEADRWQALRRIQAEYLVQLDALQLWDRQAARLVAVERNECRTERDIVLIGTVDMNRIVRRMIDQVADRVTVMIHAPASEHALFDEHGCLKPERWQQRTLNIPASCMQIVETPEDQANCVVEQLARLGGKYRPDEVAVGIANEELVPAVMQQLADAELRGRWPIGLKISQSRPYRLLSAVTQHLASARDGQPADFATLSDLIRHPDAGHWIERSCGRHSKQSVAATPVTAGRRNTSSTLTKADTPIEAAEALPTQPVAARLAAAESAAVRSEGRSALPADWLSALDQYLADHLQLTPGVMLGKGDRRQVVVQICRCVEKLLVELLPSDLRERAGNSGGIQSTGSGPSRRKTQPSSKAQRQLTLQAMDEPSSQSVQNLLTRRRTLLEWADGALRLLSAVYREHILRDDSLADRGIAECVKALQAVIDSLHHVPAAVMPKMTCVQGLQLLLRQIAEIHVPPEQDEQAVDLMGWLELPLDDSPVVILAGFNEGHVPESLTSDVFLPNSFREQLGLTDNARRYARDAYALTTMLHNRQQLHLIAGRTDRKGNPTAPSRLWFAADAKTLPARVRAFYDGAVRTGSHGKNDNDNDNRNTRDIDGTVNIDGTVPADERSEVLVAADDHQPSDTLRNSKTQPAPAATARRSGFTVPAPPRGMAMPSEIPVTAFRDYLQCPYRYFLRRELRLKSVEDETRELSAPAFGSLVHDVLNLFGESSVRDATTPEAIELFLLTELQKLSTARFGRDRSATVAVQLKMLENRLQRFAEWQASTAKEGWRILHTEADLRFAEFRDIQNRNVALIGRVDRIDRHQHSGEYRVLDYKTSEAAEKPEVTHRRKEEWIDLQLPLYRLLVQSLGIQGDVQLGYVHLPGDLNRIGCSIATWELADLESAEQKAREVAADILDLKIDRVLADDSQWTSEFSRLCQDRVIDRSIPWLTNWPGR